MLSYLCMYLMFGALKNVVHTTLTAILQSYGFLKKQSQLRGFQRKEKVRVPFFFACVNLNKRDLTQRPCVCMKGRDTMMVVLFKELNKSRLLFHAKKFGSTSPFHPYRRRIRRCVCSANRGFGDLHSFCWSYR